MRRLLFLLLACSLVPGRAAAEPAEPPQWLVVTAPAFRAALEPLCRHRQAQGMRVVVIQTSDVLSDQEVRAGEAAKLAEHVRQRCRSARGTSYVLLVGAVEAGSLADAEKKVVPPLRGTVSRMKGQPSDNGYGSPGEDRLPAVAVGRFPARSETEVQTMVQKTLAFEQD